MIFLRLLPYLAALAVLIGAYFYGYGKGEQSGYARGHQEYLEAQAAAQAALSQKLAENAQQEAQHAKTVEQVNLEYQGTIGSISARYDAELVKLRQQASAANRDRAVPKDAGPATGTDAAGPDERLVAALRGCEEDRGKLTGLQRYVTEVCLR